MSMPLARRGRWLFRAAYVLITLCSVLIASSAFAQLGSGQLEGTVTDATGAVVAGANVVVSNLGTGLTRTLVSDSNGNYRALNLPPATYSVKVTAAGFASLEKKAEVMVGSTSTVDVQLKIAGSTETMQVTETTPLVDTEKTTVANTVDSATVENIPVLARRWDNYVLLTPGVTTDGTFGLISYRGISGLYNNNTLDGMDNNQAFFSEARGRTRAVYTYSESAVKEFQVGLSNFTAEYGRAAGGMVNAVTKSGSNSYHGEAFYFIRDAITSAADPFAAGTALAVLGDKVMPERRQQFGFSVGGPVKKDKLFWFLDYDQQIRNFPYVTQFGDPAFLTGAIFDAAGNPKDPTYTTPFNANTDCREPSYGSLNCETTAAYLGNLITVVPRKALNNVAFGKLDWLASTKHSVSVQYNYSKWRSPNGVRTPLINQNAATDNGYDAVRTDSLVGRLTSILSSNMINEFRFQYGRDFESQIPNGPGPGTGIFQVFSFDQPNFLPRPRYPDEKRFQWVDNLSIVHGQHTFKFGADINYVRDGLQNLFQGGGVYSYDNWNKMAADCPEGAIALGCTRSSTAVYNYFSYTQAFDMRVLAGMDPSEAGSIAFSTTDWNFYVQDAWKIHPRVTLNFGLRYEYQALPQPQEATVLVPTSATTTDVITAVGNPDLPQTQHLPQDKNDWGPRVGFSWDVFGNQKTVVHGGYGIMYGRTSNSAISSALTNNGLFFRSIQWRATTSGRPVYPDCFEPAVNSSCGTGTLNFFGQTPDVNVIPANFRRPMIHQGELSVEHQVFSNAVIGVTYAWSAGRRLPVFRDVNLPPAGAEVYYNLTADLEARGQVIAPAGVYGPYPFYCVANTASPAGNCPDSAVRPNASFRRIIEVQSSGESDYNALIVSFRKNMSHGFMFGTNFTWAKAIDAGQNSTTFFSSSNSYYDPFNLSRDRALSDFDVRKRAVFTFVWRPDEMFSYKGSGAGKWLLGGWQLSGAATVRDGTPYTAFDSGSLNFTATRAMDTGSLNGSGGSNWLPFVGRNSVIGPGYASLDARLSKTLKLTEGTKIELLAEAFNLSNSVNYTSFTTTGFLTGTASMTATTCGTSAISAGNRCVNLDPGTTFMAPRSASSTLNGMRDFQFGARFTF